MRKKCILKKKIIREFGLQFVVKGKKKKKKGFSNCINGKRAWKIKSNFLRVKYGKSNWLKKWEKMILLIKKVENRSIKKKKKVESYPNFFFLGKLT